MKKYTKIQILNIIAFLIVPIISSFISTYHIVNFFQIGNSFVLSMFLSIAFELGALASAISITILDKISKGVTWAIFLILILFQVIGNVYYTFEYIVRQEVLDPKYLDIASRFISYFWEFETTDEVRMFLSILIGIPIPLISLAFLKTLVDYLSSDKTEPEKEEIKEEILEVVVEPEVIVPEIEIIDEIEEVEELVEPEVITPTEPEIEPEIEHPEDIDALKKELEDKKRDLAKMKEQISELYPSVLGHSYNHK